MPNVLNTGIRRIMGLVHPTAEVAWTPWSEARPRDLYALLRLYYDSNDLYRGLTSYMHWRGAWQEAMLPLRNPAYRVVEFYASKLWPGTLPDALPIETDVENEESLVAAIHRVWEWSNWGAQKQVAARHLAMLGDVFLKVVSDPARKRVFFRLIDAAHVNEFDTDERGYLTYIRVDIPQTKREKDGARSYTYTEVWTKELYRRWEHEHRDDTPVAELGRPLEELPLSAFGIDFVPFVHIQFRDVGRPRGVGAYTHALDKIDEANRQASRLHQMLFRNNKALWVVGANSSDASSRPLPAPTLTPGKDGVTAEWADESVLYLPGMSSMQALVPNINYGAALAVLDAMMAEIEKDLPELAYYRIRDMNQVSGRAVQFLLSDAIDRAREARGNAESGLIRANQMALTLGQAARIPGFAVGSYEAGDFAHWFAERDIMPLSGLERTEEERLEAEMLAVRVNDLGVSKAAAQKRMGYTEEEIAEMEAAVTASVDMAAGAMVRAIDRAPGAPPPAAGGAVITGTPAAASGPARSPVAAAYEPQFMEMMIDHHAAAIAMARLCKSRAVRAQLQRVCDAIIDAQSAEIANLQGWLSSWYGRSYSPSVAAQQAPADLARLRGPAFERRFMEMMIEHHQAAITMANETLQKAEHQELLSLAEAIISAQTSEIEQFQAWLQAWFATTASPAPGM